ncbi:uncharacterized protein VTP21DRAFT_11176 [Calcarisporiella thermophila]|uniref:uncharacterized protein n=1 Tax=Calcarisporiella thermophila TaxID=911321 RepID=UPI0037426A0E
MDISQLFSVKSKVVVVTGGSRGIGKMIASGFVSNGAKVYISSSTAEVCDQVADQLSQQGPGVCVSIPADLTKSEGIKRLVEELEKREDHLDVLVNNAGTSSHHELDTFPETKWDSVLNLNLNTPFFLTQALIPLLTAKCTHQDPSRVIMIGSIVASILPLTPGTYPYSVSKAALHRLAEVLAVDLGKRNVTVNTIAPGYFPTELTKHYNTEMVGTLIPVGRGGEPEDIVGTCIYLASRAGSFTNGATLVVDGGYKAKR